jgi:regulator of cell morphogenesis and NO signaling
MNITNDMKMADVIHYNYTLLPVITRFNINLGFGDKTVAEVCVANSVNLDFFIEITNSFADEDYIPQKDLGSFPVALIVDYLQKTHKYYLEEKIPEMEVLIEEMVNKSAAEKQKLNLVKTFFHDYRKELDKHIQQEEKNVQPYVLEIENAYHTGILDKNLYNKINTYSINDFASEHDNVEEKLFDLKNIIIKYMPPIEDRALCNRILMEIFRLEKDLNAHANLEDKVLIPKVAIMEEKLLAGYQG